MKRLVMQVSIWVLLVLIMPMRQVYALEMESISDIRIVIDVSGSMKNNDPNNLRSPALRLILGLLPADAESGVWTFATSAKSLVAHKVADDSWKEKARQQSKKIHSRGLFTNIELALNTATAEVNEGEHYKKHVILLSDGFVDVSKESIDSEQSRQRIIDELIPRLKKANIAVHTIALSDMADHDLLRTISLSTDGWYEQAESADSLQRVFLHVFEKAAKRDTVPLLDNNFKIDDSVSEMTLLVFRREGAKATELILPDQSRMLLSQLPSNVRWQSEDHYDLITVDKPISGAWQIDAEVDPDNRVMVITDLKLQTTDLPNTILIGEVFDFDISLTEKSDIIVKQDFLALVDAQLNEETEGNTSIETALNELQQEGVYRTHIGENFKPGRNDVVVLLKSATFERERRQSINVIETPFKIDVEQLTEEQTRTHRLTLTPDVNLIKADDLTIAALLTADDGSEWSYDVMQTADLEWQLTLADLQPSDKYSVALQIRGETVKGRSLFLQPTTITLIDETVEVKEEVKPEEAVDEIVEDELEIIDEMAGADDILPEVDDDLLGLEDLSADSDLGNENAMTPTMMLAIGNGIILLIALIAIFIWRRKVAARNNPGDAL